MPQGLVFRLALQEGEFGAEGVAFGLGGVEALPEGGGGLSHLGLREARGDVLGAVPVKRLERDDDAALHLRRVGGIFQPGDGFGVVLKADGAGVAEELEPPLMRVIHEDEGDAVVPAQIADADILAVAAEIGEAEGFVVQTFKEARRAAAMLDIGPAGFRDAGEIETVARGDEGALRLAQGIARTGLGRVEPLISPARAQRLLHRPHGRREHEVGEAVGHGERPVPKQIA